MDFIDGHPRPVSYSALKLSSSEGKTWTTILKSLGVVLATVGLCSVLVVLLSSQTTRRNARRFRKFSRIPREHNGFSLLSIDDNLDKPFTIRHGIPPLEVNISTFQDCIVYSSTLCTLFRFHGCDYCDRRISERDLPPDDAEYYLEETCWLAYRSLICGHFPEVGACFTCHHMYPDGFPYYSDFK